MAVNTSAMADGMPIVRAGRLNGRENVPPPAALFFVTLSLGKSVSEYVTVKSVMPLASEGRCMLPV